MNARGVPRYGLWWICRIVLPDRCFSFPSSFVFLFFFFFWRFFPLRQVRSSTSPVPQRGRPLCNAAGRTRTEQDSRFLLHFPRVWPTSVGAERRQEKQRGQTNGRREKKKRKKPETTDERTRRATLCELIRWKLSIDADILARDPLSVVF